MNLPSGLASISSRLDDAPQVRGAVAFGRMVRERQEVQDWYLGGCRDLHTDPELLADMRSAIDRHAALVIGSAYRSADRR